MPKKGDKSAKDHSESSEDDSDSEFNVKRYRELLQEIFPSKYMKDKVKKDKEKDEVKNKKSKRSKASSSKKVKSPVKSKSDKKSKNKRKKHVSTSESSSEEESTSDMSVGTDSDGNLKNQKFNIVFTMGGGFPGRDEDGSDSEWDSDDLEQFESCSSGFSTEYDSSDDSYKPESMSTTESSEASFSNKSNRRRRSRRIANKKKEDKRCHDKNSDSGDSDCDSKNELKLVTQYKTAVTELAEKHKSSKLLKSLIKDANDREKRMSKGIKKKERKQRTKNTKEFRGLAKERNPMNDIRYFRDELSIAQQDSIIREAKQVTEIMKVEKPYRLKVLEADIPQTFKACALKKVNLLRYMSPGEGEYYKLKSWVDAFMRIPFNRFSSLPITLEDGVDKCHNFME